MGLPQLQDWILNGFGLLWDPYTSGLYGILSMAFYTLYTATGATVMATAIGIPCAIYLAEYANNKIRNIIKPSLEVLTSMPSILVGLVGVVLIVLTIQKVFNLSGSGIGVMAAWIVLFVLALPLVASIAEDAIRAVPSELKEASLALGATQWQTTLKVSLPGAKSGILTALILALGSSIGETMAVWMVIGGGMYPSIAPSLTYLFGSVDTIPTLIAANYKQGEITLDLLPALMGAAFILFVIVGGLNVILRRFIQKKQ